MPPCVLVSLGWWLVVGDSETSHLHCLKRVFIGSQSKTHRLTLSAPERPGQHEWTIFVISDSYIGLDQEYEFVMNAAAGPDLSVLEADVNSQPQDIELGSSTQDANDDQDELIWG